MRKVEGWQAGRLKVAELFNTYTAWFKTHHASLMDDPQSDYRKMKKQIENFSDKFDERVAELEREDEKRNLYTLEDRPASLMDYPQFGGKDSQYYFQYEEKMKHALKVNKVPLVDQVAKIRVAQWSPIEHGP